MPTPIIKRVPTLWTALEEIRGLTAIPAVWREFAGNDFPVLKNFLELSDDVAGWVPCNQCSCLHDVVTLPDGSIVGVCRCHEIGIHDIELKREDIAIWHLNQPKFARAICTAFGVASKYEKFGPAGTAQIGTWSSDTVPVILTIQWNGHELPAVIAELALRLKRPFILLSPTNTHLTAHCQELLAHANSEFFALDSHLHLTPNGTFQPRSLPGEIFARFRPEPHEPHGERVARQTVELAKAMDAEQRFRKAPIYTVLLLYCAENLTVNQIAKRCRCSRSLVFTRLKSLQQKLGCNPADFRQYSAHFEPAEQSLSDPRARNVYRKGAAYGNDTDDSEE